VARLWKGDSLLVLVLSSSSIRPSRRTRKRTRTRKDSTSVLLILSGILVAPGWDGHLPLGHDTTNSEAAYLAELFVAGSGWCCVDLEIEIRAAGIATF
jgi:hypothetical protein